MLRIFITLLIVQALPNQWQGKSCALDNKNPTFDDWYEDDKWYGDDPQDGKADATPRSSGLTATSTNVQICRKEEDFSLYRNSIATLAPTFQNLVEDSHFWSDKSLLIETVLTDRCKVHVITCPRRSGKSTNLNMISKFVEIPLDKNNQPIPLKSSFAYKYFVTGTVNSDGTDVEVTPPPLISKNKKLIAHRLGKYPVIYLDLASIKVDNNLDGLKDTISDLYLQHDYVIEPNNSNAVSRPRIVSKYDRILSKSIDQNELKNSLKFLSEVLFKYYDKRVLIFIDEYDHFINKLVLPQYKNEGLNVDGLIEFYRDFLVSSIKQNNYLKKAVLTGIVKIAEITGLSNWEGGAQVVNLMEPTEFSEFYRLTPNEVEQLLSLAKNQSHTPNAEKFKVKNYLMKDVANYYDGYTTYGNLSLSTYNTLSVVSFINNAELKRYWVDSSMINSFWALFRFELFETAISNLYDNLEYSMAIKDIKDIDWKELNELRVFIQNTNVSEGFSENHLRTTLSLLSFMGYLTPVTNSLKGGRFNVRIPNMEIRESIYEEWSYLFIYETIPTEVQNNYVINSLKDFFTDSIVKATALMNEDFFKSKLLSIFTKVDPVQIKNSYHNITEISKSKKTRFKKFFHIWKVLFDLCRKCVL